MRYAILNEKNKCTAVTNFAPDESNCLPLSENAKSENYLGKIYNSDSEKWEEDLPLNRIEKMLNKNYAQAQQDAVDAYTLELLEGGVI